MAGTRAGGLKTASRNIAKDPDFYSRIGSIGGKRGAGSQKGFAASHDIAVAAGAKAGKLSKRGRKYLGTEGAYNVYKNVKTGEIERYKA